MTIESSVFASWSNSRRAFFEPEAKLECAHRIIFPQQSRNSSLFFEATDGLAQTYLSQIFAHVEESSTLSMSSPKSHAKI